ncbi:MAG: hypothetical protein AUK47_00825 [Deltaproteobacteria bacterium CG2_30_63_29]|nr:MAG: hypothetical protein AUK47_00825 [Deltaproteobacteria bacterium CG2_30_63_29]PJB38637.1 MAG: hypothetical protein CO108_18630 [Deltaproteobacteria bacterium CG_4_9_14_3_um_filter_63_12]
MLGRSLELSLGDTLDTFLPKFLGASAISVGQPLNHTSGLYDYVNATRNVGVRGPVGGLSVQ